MPRVCFGLVSSVLDGSAEGEEDEEAEAGEDEDEEEVVLDSDGRRAATAVTNTSAVAASPR